MTALSALPSVLVADDQPDVRTSLHLALKCAGFDAQMADSPEAVLTAIALRQYDVVLMDLNYTRDTTSGGEGLDLLPRIKAIDHDLPVVAMTAWAIASNRHKINEWTGRGKGGPFEDRKRAIKGSKIHVHGAASRPCRSER